MKIILNPKITPEELYEFYVKNDICEKGYGIEIATKPLSRNSIIVAAYSDDELIGITNAMFNGVSAVVMEFCVAVKCQGEDTVLENGSMMEKDSQSVGKKMGEVLISELHRMGAYFISATVCEEFERDFYENIGFVRNDGHVEYVIDTRPYVEKNEE